MEKDFKLTFVLILQIRCIFLLFLIYSASFAEKKIVAFATLKVIDCIFRRRVWNASQLKMSLINVLPQVAWHAMRANWLWTRKRSNVGSIHAYVDVYPRDWYYHANQTTFTCPTASEFLSHTLSPDYHLVPHCVHVRGQ